MRRYRKGPLVCPLFYSFSLLREPCSPQRQWEGVAESDLSQAMVFDVRRESERGY